MDEMKYTVQFVWILQHPLNFFFQIFMEKQKLNNSFMISRHKPSKMEYANKTVFFIISSNKLQMNVYNQILLVLQIII